MTDRTVDIFLVEDDPGDLELALLVLGKHSPRARIETAVDGQVALDFLLGGESAPGPLRPRVIFLDLKLPRIDGLEVLRRIKGDPDTRGIPVVVLSSSRLDADVQRSYSLGSNSYVVKPVDFKHYSETMGRLAQYWLALNQAPPRPSASGELEPSAEVACSIDGSLPRVKEKVAP